jgi:site-specific DNA-adenine methylase
MNKGNSSSFTYCTTPYRHKNATLIFKLLQADETRKKETVALVKTVLHSQSSLTYLLRSL